jgi:flagellar FliL protein
MSAKKEPVKAGAAAPAAKSGKGKMIAIVLGAVVAASALGGGVTWFMVGKPAAASTENIEDAKDGGETEHAAADDADGASKPPAKAAKYLALDPALVVNLAGADSSRYLQVSIEVMTRNEAALGDLKLHMPAIRNNLLMLFGQQTADGLAGRDGREALRQLALTEVQKVMREETGNDAIEALYFTSFVTQ